MKVYASEYIVDHACMAHLSSGSFSIDDSPYTTDILLEDGAAGNTDIAAIVVFDGVADAQVSLSG